MGGLVLGDKEPQKNWNIGKLDIRMVMMISLAVFRVPHLVVDGAVYEAFILDSEPVLAVVRSEDDEGDDHEDDDDDDGYDGEDDEGDEDDEEYDHEDHEDDEDHEGGEDERITSG